MEDEKETEKVDEYEKDKTGVRSRTTVIYPAADSVQTFKSLRNNSLAEDFLSDCTFC